MATLFQAFLSGVVANNPLATGGTSLSATALANMPVVASPNCMWITLDPNGVNGLPEMVQVIAHTASATTCTIVRGQQTSNGGNAAHAHIQNTPWVVAQTPADTARVAQFGSTTPLVVNTSGTTEITCCTLVVPDQGVSGTLSVTATNLIGKSVGGDVFYVYLRTGGILFAASRADNVTATIIHVNLAGMCSMAAGSAVTLTMSVLQVFGTGSANTVADGIYNHIIATFIPN